MWYAVFKFGVIGPYCGGERTNTVTVTVQRYVYKLEHFFHPQLEESREESHTVAI